MMKKVGENDYVEFFQNDETFYLDRILSKTDSNGITLKDHHCYLAVGKNSDFRELVCLNGQHEAMLIQDDVYNMETSIVAYRLELALRK